MRTLILGLSIALLMGCAPEDGDSPYSDALPPAYDSTYVGANNSGVLSGELVGENAEETGSLSRKLELTTISGSSGLTVYKPILTRHNGASTLKFKLMIEVLNNTQDRTYCGVKLKGLILKLEEGDEVGTDLSEIEIIGGIGLANSRDFRFCLAPGQTGVGFADITPTTTQAFVTAVFEDDVFDLFRDAWNLQVGGVVYGSASAAQPTMVVLPTAYSYGDKLSVDVVNSYPDAARVRLSKSYYVLYRYDEPIWMDSINTLAITSKEVAGDSGTATFDGDAVPFAGASSDIGFFFYFTN